MAYNLPSPWNPGFALPDNVHDEGLERRAFITKMLPRGSYDPSTDGTGGYAVPQYVLDEGTGQGTYTTKWAPSGSYAGPKVPNWLNRRPQVVASRKLPGGGQVATVQPGPLSGMGDTSTSVPVATVAPAPTPMPAAMEQYGSQAAQVLISSVSAVPANKRSAALRAQMDRLDKSLWTRTQGLFLTYQQQGMPPEQAFPTALQRALSTGFTASIIKGGFRQLGTPKGMGGMGHYSGLGAIKEAGPGGQSTGTATTVTKNNTPQQNSQIVATALANGAYYDSNGILRYPVQTGILDTITGAITGGIATVGGAVTGGIATAGGAVGTAVQATTNAVATAAATVVTATGDTISMAGKAVVNAAGTVVNWVVNAAGAVYDAGGTLIGWVKDAAGAIYDAAGKLVGWIVDAVQALGGLACDALNTPGLGAAVGAAATAVGTVYGGPAGGAAGQVGTQLAKQACAPPAPPVVLPSSSLSPTVQTLLWAGAAVAVVLLVLPPKKKVPTP